MFKILKQMTCNHEWYEAQYWPQDACRWMECVHCQKQATVYDHWK